ncbi:hypothetical protein ACFL2M_00210 [Patescibacteria group bacterium]
MVVEVFHNEELYAVIRTGRQAEDEASRKAHYDKVRDTRTSVASMPHQARVTLPSGTVSFKLRKQKRRGGNVLIQLIQVTDGVREGPEWRFDWDEDPLEYGLTAAAPSEDASTALSIRYEREKRVRREPLTWDDKVDRNIARARREQPEPPGWPFTAEVEPGFGVGFYGDIANYGAGPGLEVFSAPELVNGWSMRFSIRLLWTTDHSTIDGVDVPLNYFQSGKLRYGFGLGAHLLIPLSNERLAVVPGGVDGRFIRQYRFTEDRQREVDLSTPLGVVWKPRTDSRVAFTALARPGLFFVYLGDDDTIMMGGEYLPGPSGAIVPKISGELGILLFLK